MKSVIVGTAGHIDHGKTALVKALTGIDADRLKEEKRRGITIDIGFAHLELPAPGGTAIRFGFVDVPGHERFVRNMLAGIGGIDMVLLIVAANESVMPQTKEHFDICRLLSIRRGITVLTKSDLVDSETLEVVRLEVEDYLRGTFLDAKESPIIPVSVHTGNGLDLLKSALIRIAGEIPSRDILQPARLPIDRVFVIRGFGTVVTGTLIAGSIRKDEEMEVFPSRRRVRVRGIQVHNSSVESAEAGQRTALNLAGIDAEDLGRGMMLAPPGLFHPAKNIDVRLSLLASARPLANHTRVHLYAHASEVVAEVDLHSDRQIVPGSSAYAQLRLAEPVLVLPGDRFIVRQMSPVITIGGGAILNASPAHERKKARREKIIPFLETLQNGTDAEILAARIGRHAREGMNRAGIISETGWRKDRAESVIAQLADKVICFGDVFVLHPVAEHLKAEMLRLVDNYLKANPLSAGMAREELREKMRLNYAVFSGILGMLLDEKKLGAAGELIRLAGQGIIMKDEEAEAKAQIEQALGNAGLNAPLLKELLANLKIDKARAQKILYLLFREKVLIRVDDDYVFHKSAIDDLHRRLSEYKTRSTRISIPQFKELIGVTRKHAMALLIYLDREHTTMRSGTERILL